MVESLSHGCGRAVGAAVRLGHAHHVRRVDGIFFSGAKPLTTTCLVEILCSLTCELVTLGDIAVVCAFTGMMSFWYCIVTVTRRFCAIPRQCVSIERPNATAMRLPPYVLHSRGFYRGKNPSATSGRYVGRCRRSAGRRKSFGPGDAGAGAQSHPPLECWLALVRKAYVCVYTRFIRTHLTSNIQGDPVNARHSLFQKKTINVFENIFFLVLRSR